ncbi:MAG: nitrous oxide reductase accessory protein NosL [Candidatus Marinimicrobia bacterium]|nr:nitrous oxide reductase accessory protein NosL [Candidatus Neomarinimicrobiota bacterium]
MNKRIFLTLILLLSVNILLAQSRFVKSAQTDQAMLLQTGQAKTWCPICGMNLMLFYKTNHALELADGSTHQYCSIRCLAVDLKDHPDQITHAQVVDVNSERFIAVQDAHYVIDSKVSGTMTRESKLAFGSFEEAKQFSKKHGGRTILGFTEALDLARTQMQADNAMLMKKKQSIVFPKGEKLFNKFSAEIGTLPPFESIVDLKAHLKTRSGCKSLDEKKLQMLALYIFNANQQHSGRQPAAQVIQVSKDEKCPVCGMFVYKYPRWVAVLNITINNQPKKLYFDGVKDLMKFYHNPQKWGKYEHLKIHEVVVTDYYQQTALDGRKAEYVIGSDILGPMGHELIPFDSITQAKVFLDDHAGSRILKFSEITEQLISDLDNN